MSYWEEQKKQPNFKAWLDFYNGCLICDCGHGCRNWLEEQRSKAALIMEVQNNKSATTCVDKIAQMDPKRADDIWVRIMWWRSDKLNRELREQEEKERLRYE